MSQEHDRIYGDARALGDRILRMTGEGDAVCVDVFDTLLYRLCLPETVIERSCADLAGRARLDWWQVRGLRSRIVRALKSRAESRGLDREWRLREMLRTLLGRIGLPDGEGEVESAAQGELDRERIAVTPGEETARLIERLASEGRQVHFVSDTYLSGEDVGALLAHHGIAGSVVGGFTSSGPLLLKSTGRLFGHVAERLGVEPRRIVHLGDNPKSDMARADRAGVRGFWWLDRRHAARCLRLEWEGRRMGRDPDRRARYRHLCAGPGGRHGALFEVGRRVVAPVAAHLALHVLEEHAREPFDRILFVAREGITLLAAAREMARAAGMDVGRETLGYAMLSRAAVRLPAADPEEPLSAGSWVIGTKSRVASARDYLAQFLLPGELIDAWVAEGDGEDRVEALTRDPGFLEALDRERRRQTDLLIEYLGQIGWAGARRVALVDAGWAGSTQDALARLLPPPRGPGIRGFYLGLTTDGARPAPGSMKEGFLVDRWNEGPGRLGVQFTAGAIRLWELLTRAAHGTVRGYEVVGTDPRVIGPVLGPSLREEVGDDPERLEAFAEVQRGIVRGLEEIARAVRLECVRPLASRRVARRIAHRFLAYPTAEESRALIELPFVQDAGQSRRESIGREGLATGTAWVPGVLAASGLGSLQPAFDLVCLGNEIARKR